MFKDVLCQRGLVVAVTVLACSGVVSADQRGRGLTANFEVEFLKLVIDHHFSALRMTELAAGTDVTRSAEISPREGTAPTPGFPAATAKATLDDLKSLARRNNRMQREEIQELQARLQSWYGIAHEPTIQPESQAMLDVLDKAAPGSAFNHAFYEVFSRHHFTLMEPISGA